MLHRRQTLVRLFQPLGLGVALWAAVWPQAGAAELAVTPGQRAQAQQVAQAGVPVSELAPDAPASHTVQPGDTLWDISGLFLKKAWRWPQLWGMNLEQIKNPHRIYPGQVLVLVKDGDRALLKLASPGTAGTPPTNTVKLSPRIRSENLPSGAIAPIPMHLIAPFLADVDLVDTGALDAAPKVLGGKDQRVFLTKGDTAYVRGELPKAPSYHLVREPRALRDPVTGEVLGYETRHVGTAEFLNAGGGETSDDQGRATVQPAAVRISQVRLEVQPGDRLTPGHETVMDAFVPRAPAQAVDGRVIGLYGEGVQAAQNQIVSLNKGARDGLERGHVLALWRHRAPSDDRSDPARQKAQVQWPDVREGELLVFRVFDRVSYALIRNSMEPVKAGDRFTQP